LPAWAETFKLTDGTTVEGEMVLPAKADALQLRLGGGKYEKIPWEKLSQETLLQLKDNPAVAQFVAPLIEISDEEKIKKTEVVVQPVPRLERPSGSSVLGGLFGSPVGLLALLLIYAANIYAGYELAIVRAYPPLLVCGIAAVAPIIGPVIFLFLPTRLASANETTLVEAAVATQTHAASVHETAAAHQAAQSTAQTTLHTVAPSTSESTPNLPEPQVFKRGQFTFNRRFIETKFASFFGIARREADKEMVLVIKAGRHTVTASRITRIAANDMHVETQQGEIQIGFADVQEIVLKHKDS
jgi:hypothetical protein